MWNNGTELFTVLAWNEVAVCTEDAVVARSYWLRYSPEWRQIRTSCLHRHAFQGFPRPLPRPLTTPSPAGPRGIRRCVTQINAGRARRPGGRDALEAWFDEQRIDFCESGHLDAGGRGSIIRMRTKLEGISDDVISSIPTAHFHRHSDPRLFSQMATIWRLPHVTERLCRRVKVWISQLPKICVRIGILMHRIFHFFILWARSFSTRLTSVTFAEDKVLSFLILRKNAKIVQLWV